MRTNQGKTFAVNFSDSNNESFGIKVYATNEDHARKIFEAAYEDCTIDEIYEDDDCISQHYGRESGIPEFNLAEKVTYAILAELQEDDKVYAQYAQNVLDIAYHMASCALKHVVEYSDEIDKQK